MPLANWDEPLGYYVFNGDKRLWLRSVVTSSSGASVEWSENFFEAFEFDSLDEANEQMQAADTKTSDTFYVFALQSSPA